jgi:hypothetical protein
MLTLPSGKLTDDLVVRYLRRHAGVGLIEIGWRHVLVVGMTILSLLLAGIVVCDWILKFEHLCK